VHLVISSYTRMWFIMECESAIRMLPIGRIFKQGRLINMSVEGVATYLNENMQFLKKIYLLLPNFPALFAWFGCSVGQ